jgi:hypothetical protein
MTDCIDEDDIKDHVDKYIGKKYPGVDLEDIQIKPTSTGYHIHSDTDIDIDTSGLTPLYKTCDGKTEEIDFSSSTMSSSKHMNVNNNAVGGRRRRRTRRSRRSVRRRKNTRRSRH